MKKMKKLLKIACIAIVLHVALSMNSASAQSSVPTIFIGGVEVMANNISLAPYWLYAGQTLAIGNKVKNISVLQYNIAPAQGGGNSLQFETVLQITTLQTVPTGKAWKIESIGLDPTASTSTTGPTGATGPTGPTGTNGTNGAVGAT